MAAGADIGVTVFCESGTAGLKPCLASIGAARGRFRLDVTIVAHGTRASALDRAANALKASGLAGRIFHIEHGDAANALNHAMGTLRRPARLHVFIDNGTVIAPDTLSGFAALLSRHPEAFAATGVPARDRPEAAETLREGGRLHGPLFALRPAFLDRFATAGLRIPLGLCSAHWLLARMACHDLDARQHRWDKQRILGATEAIFDQPGKRLGSTERRMRGFMEVAALSGLIAREGFCALPEHADKLLAAWLEAGGTVPATRRERFFVGRATRRLGAGQPWLDSACQPALAFDVGS